MRMRFISMAALALFTMSAAAQETYQSANLVTTDLNGTARYVGMGGAMEALGADISTMSTNPAGIGLFRRSVINMSAGLVTQTDADTHLSINGSYADFDGDKTKLSFDQLGFVYSRRVGRRSYLNFGFNYHKSRNFNQILSAVGGLYNASQSKITAMKYDNLKPFYSDRQNLNQSIRNDPSWNMVDENYAQLLAYDEDLEKYDFMNSTAYMFGQYQKGYIGEYDFNISGNINERVYLGLTLGIHDVNYRSDSYYSEDFDGGGFSESLEELKIDGTGFDIKLGVIVRPFEESPFRIGAYVNSPIFYDLEMDASNGLYMTDNSNEGESWTNPQYPYDFRINTPWKFGVSLGHTVGNFLALGATYEYSDYSTIDNRIKDDGYWYDDWYGDYYYDASSSDDVMNRHTENSLKGVHTLKLGLEVKPMPQFAIRAGYNFVSAVFDKDAFRDGSLPSPGVAYATSTNYTNWKSTNRFTLGAGYVGKHFTVDLAYQYSATNGDFYPFMQHYEYVVPNKPDSEYNLVSDVSATKVSNYRHQLLLTLGYKF